MDNNNNNNNMNNVNDSKRVFNNRNNEPKPHEPIPNTPPPLHNDNTYEPTQNSYTAHSYKTNVVNQTKNTNPSSQVNQPIQPNQTNNYSNQPLKRTEKSLASENNKVKPDSTSTTYSASNYQSNTTNDSINTQNDKQYVQSNSKQYTQTSNNPYNEPTNSNRMNQGTNTNANTNTTQNPYTANQQYNNQQKSPYQNPNQNINTNPNQQQYQNNTYGANPNTNYNNANTNPYNNPNNNYSNPNNNYQPAYEEPNNHGAVWKIVGCLGISLLALLLCGFLIYQAVSGVMNNNNNNNNNNDNNTEQTDNNNNNNNNDNKTAAINEDQENNDNENKEKDENNNSANRETVSFDEGIYTVGEDIQPGRYMVGSKNNGNLFVNDGNRALNINEIVGTGDEDVIVQIEKGQKIEIKTANEVKFKPIEDKMYEGELLAGIYEVGKHIEPGTYKFISLDDRFTTINTFEKVDGKYDGKEYESINNKDKKETELTINEGEILNIQNAIKVKIEKQ